MLLNRVIFVGVHKLGVWHDNCKEFVQPVSVLTHNVFIREKDVKANNEKGFTMIEVAVVLLLVSTMAFISAPRAMSMLRAYYFSNDLRVMVSVLNKARSKSIQTGGVTSVSFQTNEVNDGTRARYIAFVDNGAGGGTENDGIRNGEEEIIADVLMHQGVLIGPANFNPDLNAGQSISFNGQGFAMGFIGGVQKLYNGTIPASQVTMPDDIPSATGVIVGLSGYARIKRPE
jgi:prepilin-type N-terminal cleavage/methylation domain-containing protein